MAHSLFQDLSTRLLNILDLVDDETIDVQGNVDLGMAFTKGTLPVAFNIHVSATGAGEPSIAEGDRAYIQEFETLLDNDTLTLSEAQSSAFLTVDAFGIPLGVEQPEDVLTSEAQGSALIRTQLGVSFASSLSGGRRHSRCGHHSKILVLESVQHITARQR